MRIAAGGLLHETSSYSVQPTRLRDFETGFGLYRGQEIVDRFAGANMCIGGFIDGARREGFELVPLLWGFAYPSGLIDAGDYAALKAEFLQRLKDAEAQGPIDGVLLDLHGAMVVDGINDGDGDFIASVREVVGKRPIMVAQDLHGNHTLRRVQAADAICGYDTYPHVDMNERGQECARLIAAQLRGEIRPVMAFRSLPLFWSTICQVTAHPPMDEVLRRVHEIESRPGMLSVTISTGFPWADVPHVGASVIAVADGDPALAEAAADELARWVWENRARWYAPPVSLSDAIAQGRQGGKYPVVLADHADNTGGGTPGDSTEVLRTFLEQGIQDSVVLYIVDPEVAEQAHAAGVGSRIETALGGKSHPDQGPPVEGEFEVVALSDGGFTYDGPMFAGLTGNMGRSAWLRRDGVSAVVVSQREQPLGPAFARTLGIDCTQMKFICVKSAAHFRAAFEPIAGAIINVDCAGIQTHDFRRLKYVKRQRDVFPVEIGPG